MIRVSFLHTFLLALNVFLYILYSTLRDWLLTKLEIVMITDNEDFKTIQELAKESGYTAIWIYKVAFFKEGVCASWNMSLATALCHAMFHEFE